MLGQLRPFRVENVVVKELDVLLHFGDLVHVLVEQVFANEFGTLYAKEENFKQTCFWKIVLKI